VQAMMALFCACAGTQITVESAKYQRDSINRWGFFICLLTEPDSDASMLTV